MIRNNISAKLKKNDKRGINEEEIRAGKNIRRLANEIKVGNS